MDQLVTIEVFGRPFTFKADSNVESAREVAGYFEKEVARIEAQFNAGSSNMDKRALLILTALNITNEYFKLREKHHALLNNINDRSNTLINILDARTNC